MLQKINTMLCLVMILIILSPLATAASITTTPPLPAVLDVGVQAIISETDSQITANYQEMVFITGEPILATGTVLLGKASPGLIR